MLKVGIIGFGFMGRMHHRCWLEQPDVAVAAICEADTRAFADTGRGNIAGAEATVDLSGVHLYADLAEMLAHERLDAVSVAVPTHLHAQVTLRALEVGCNVLCEKPMAIDLAEGRAMIDAAQRRGLLLQVGHCVRFWPEYAKARELVEGRAYGRVLAASFVRLAATASRRPGTWYTNEAQSGGVALDLHIHDTDFIQYAFGMPRAVQSWGVTAPGGDLLHMATRYAYDDGRLVTAEGGWAMMPSFGFQMRFHVAMETGHHRLRLPTQAGAAIVSGRGGRDRARLRGGRRLLAPDRPLRPAPARRGGAAGHRPRRRLEFPSHRAGRARIRPHRPRGVH